MEKEDEKAIVVSKFKKNLINFGQHNKQRQAMNATPNLVDDNMVEDTLIGVAACVKVIDLTDSNLDTTGACALFDLAFAVFIKSTKATKAIALDEAHNASTGLLRYWTLSSLRWSKYLDEGIGSAEFTEDLLKVVREQRHDGIRIVIATQEPAISTKYLDPCTFLSSSLHLA